VEGKARAGQNALKHGLRSAAFLADRKRVHAALRSARAVIKKAQG